jgi:hypothetical protein
VKLVFKKLDCATEVKLKRARKTKIKELRNVKLLPIISEAKGRQSHKVWQII